MVFRSGLADAKEHMDPVLAVNATRSARTKTAVYAVGFISQQGIGCFDSI